MVNAPDPITGDGPSGSEDRGGGELRLYVAGQTPKSVAALRTSSAVCEEHLPGRYRIEVVDLLQNPQLARTDQIVAIPTLVRKPARPAPQGHRRPVEHRDDARRADNPR